MATFHSIQSTEEIELEEFWSELCNLVAKTSLGTFEIQSI